MQLSLKEQLIENTKYSTSKEGFIEGFKNNLLRMSMNGRSEDKILYMDYPRLEWIKEFVTDENLNFCITKEYPEGVEFVINW